MMTKVKFVGDVHIYTHLIKGGVYNVERFIPCEYKGEGLWDIVVIKVNGVEYGFYLYDGENRQVFRDVTSIYRNEVIDEILL